MKRGPKPQTPATKKKRATLRKDRDGDAAVKGELTQMVVVGDPPMMPDYLQDDAQEVWMEEIGRVMSFDVTDLDSSLFATYCSLEANCRKAFKAKEPPPAAYLTELRRMRELLGIAGPRTRIGAKSGGAKTDNPFAKKGRRVQ